jgi:hypothetical protein
VEIAKACESVKAATAEGSVFVSVGIETGIGIAVTTE